MTAKKTHGIELVRPDAVSTDPRVQRPLDQSRVTAIVTNFKEAALGLILLSKRPDGSMICIDGQTRIAVLLRKNLGAVPRQMLVHRGLTLPEEAELFGLHNNTKTLSPQVRFRVALLQGDPLTVASDAILVAHGWTSEIGKGASWRAVDALKKTVQRDAESAEAALKLIGDCWEVHSRNSSADVLKGFSNVLFRYKAAANIQQLRERITRAGTQAHLLGQARTLASMRRVSVFDAVSDITVGVYNHGRPASTSLPDWKTGLA